MIASVYRGEVFHLETRRTSKWKTPKWNYDCCALNYTLSAPVYLTYRYLHSHMWYWCSHYHWHIIEFMLLWSSHLTSMDFVPFTKKGKFNLLIILQLQNDVLFVLQILPVSATYYQSLWYCMFTRNCCMPTWATESCTHCTHSLPDILAFSGNYFILNLMLVVSQGYQYNITSAYPYNIFIIIFAF